MRLLIVVVEHPVQNGLMTSISQQLHSVLPWAFPFGVCLVRAKPIVYSMFFVEEFNVDLPRDVEPMITRPCIKYN